ncbi:transposase domain-containing protein [Gluconobacter morbifer]|uniref:transposase domain-containing protein n=1 Tax=Gluconobacter morbifer TaxID=479935 RepID=UPI001FE1984B|nr:transposase domain-containing protein [Gluconobacter morbifer]
MVRRDRPSFSAVASETGGIPNRFRFKVKEDEPVGIMTQLGVEVHWTTPYSGQSKPIERAWTGLPSGR